MKQCNPAPLLQEGGVPNGRGGRLFRYTINQCLRFHLPPPPIGDSSFQKEESFRYFYFDTPSQPVPGARPLRLIRTRRCAAYAGRGSHRGCWPYPSRTAAGVRSPDRNRHADTCHTCGCPDTTTCPSSGCGAR